MKDLIFLGIQWCGKGTQADLLLKDLKNYEYMEMGQLCRALMANDNCIGNYIRNIVNNGIMVDNFITHDLLHSAIQIAEKGNLNLLIDGFPRLMPQADYLIKIMQEYSRDFTVVHFELSKDKALERLKNRATIEWRKDDAPEAMERRVSIFIDETLPVIKRLEEMGKVITINADNTIENIQAELRNKLGL